jgi:hypothetical protein
MAEEAAGRGTYAAGVVLMAGGLAAHLLRRDPEPEPEIINAAVFSSSLAPTVSVTAPPPWRFEHDAQKGQLTGLRPGAVFMIETSFINDSAGGAPAILDAVGKGLRSRGATPVGQPFTQPVAGLDASGQIMTVGIGSSALWVVPRGGTLFTVIVCTSESGPDARTACDPVLSTLKWRRPGPR